MFLNSPFGEVTIKYVCMYVCIQLILTLKMTTAQIVKTSVTVSNSPIIIKDYVHAADHAQPTPEMTRSFKPFTECFFYWFNRFLVQVTVLLNIYVRSPFERYTPILNHPIFSDWRQF